MIQNSRPTFRRNKKLSVILMDASFKILRGKLGGSMTVSLSWKVNVLFLISLAFLFGSRFVCRAQSIPGGIALLEGYKYEKEHTRGVLSSAGIIYRENGLRIEFEEGLNQGYWAEPSDLTMYSW